MMSKANHNPPTRYPVLRFPALYMSAVALATSLPVLVPERWAVDLAILACALIAFVAVLEDSLHRGASTRSVRKDEQARVNAREERRHPFENAPPCSAFYDWLGPFNPDNGLSADISPYFAEDHISLSNPIFADDDDWNRHMD